MHYRAYQATRSKLARVAILVLAALVLVGTSPAIAAASQSPKESHPADEKALESSNVQMSWDLVDGSGNLHYQLDTAYADYFEAAAASWNELGVVNIEPTPSSSETDVYVSDGSLGGPMATTRSDGQLTFDTALMDQSSANAQQTAAAHELGHALGFGHVDAESVMQTPIISNSSSNNSEPTSYDRQEYRERWGSGDNSGSDNSGSDDSGSSGQDPSGGDNSGGGGQQPQGGQYPRGGGGGGDDSGPSTSPEPDSSGGPDTDQWEQFFSEGDGDDGSDESTTPDGGTTNESTGGDTPDQPDSSRQTDDGSESPETGWTPEECFPFCETGGSSSSGDDATDGSSGSGTDPGDTTAGDASGEGSSSGAGSNEDGPSRGFTHAPDGGDDQGDSAGDGPINDQVMTSDEACEALGRVQKDLPEDAREGFTSTVENAADCGGSGSGSSGDDPDAGSPGEERGSGKDGSTDGTTSDSGGDGGEETVTDDETTRRSTNDERVDEGDTQVSNEEEIDQGNRGDATATDGDDGEAPDAARSTTEAAASGEAGERAADTVPQAKDQGGENESCGQVDEGDGDLASAISERVACEIGQDGSTSGGGSSD